MQAWSTLQYTTNRSIALIPTMGFLHEGHLSLIREAAKQSDEVVVSIFVNPTQFGPNEDLSTYPRDEAGDIEKATTAGATCFYCPTAELMYPDDFQTSIRVNELQKPLCGAKRKGHFDGVATVVTKLFLTVKPQHAYFGRKDFQQLALLKRLANDLNFEVKIVGMPIVREPDGLAMSSRNAYLNEAERKQATCLYKAHQKAKALFECGESNPKILLDCVKQTVSQHSLAQIDYIELLDASTLQDVPRVIPPCVLAMAVFVGKTRLIDNIVLE